MLKKTIVLFVLALSVLMMFSIPAQAAGDFETGADLYKLCQQAADPAKRDAFSFGLCMGYIDGYISGYMFKHDLKDTPPICDDIEKRSRRQVLNDVVDYLAKHPQTQSELKSISMYRAMVDKMTCAVPGKDEGDKTGSKK